MDSTTRQWKMAPADLAIIGRAQAGLEPRLHVDANFFGVLERGFTR
jgi:hypothetical protein